LESAEPASVLAILLLLDRARVLLAAVATFELVRTEFVFFAMLLTSFRVGNTARQRATARNRGVREGHVEYNTKRERLLDV